MLSGVVDCMIPACHRLVTQRFLLNFILQNRPDSHFKTWYLAVKACILHDCCVSWPFARWVALFPRFQLRREDNTAAAIATAAMLATHATCKLGSSAELVRELCLGEADNGNRVTYVRCGD